MHGSVLQAKLQLQRLLAHRQVLVNQNGLQFYRPHKKQGWFHSHGGYKYRYLRTGNRFGKSDCGVAEDVAFALGERPWLPKDDPNRYIGIPQKSTAGIILCTDWTKAEEIFTCQEEGTSQGKLFKFIPKDAIVRVHKDHGGHICKVTVKSIWGGNSTIKIDTIVAWKQNDQKAESASYDWIHVDEPIPRKMFIGYSRGLMDRDGKVWFTCTPLREPWINSFFRPHRRAKVDREAPNYHGKDRVMIVGSSIDNPYNSQAGMESFDETLDEKEKAARMHGEPLENSGVIYHMFGDEHIYVERPKLVMADLKADRDANHNQLWERVDRPPKHYTIRYHLDCHPETPHAVLFAATAPDETVYLFDEIWSGVDADELAKMIKEITDGYFVASELCDPSAFIKSMSTKTTLAETFLEHGLVLEKGAKDPSRGIIEVKRAFNTKGLIKVSDQLVRFLGEIEEYVWDDPQKRPDKPMDKNDHFMESLYRLVLGGLSYIDAGIFDRPSRNNDSVSNLLEL